MTCMTSACFGRLRAFGAALVLAMLAGPAPSPAAGDGPIADPKIWCGDVARLIADRGDG